MKKHFIALLVAALAFPIAQAAPFAPQAYMGLNAGQAEHKLSADGIGSDTEKKTSVKVYGGYNFTENFGAELGYANFGKFRVSEDAIGVNMKTSAVYAAVTGTVPVTPEFALFGKVGVTTNHIKGTIDSNNFQGSGTKNETAAMFGVGASYLVVPNVSLVVEYENFGKLFKDSGAEIKTNTVTGGVRYAF